MWARPGQWSRDLRTPRRPKQNKQSLVRVSCYNCTENDGMTLGVGVKSYNFQVELEVDEEGWRAFYPPFEELGASTWGINRSEALKNIQEVLSMIVEEWRNLLIPNA